MQKSNQFSNSSGHYKNIVERMNEKQSAIKPSEFMSK